MKIAENGFECDSVIRRGTFRDWSKFEIYRRAMPRFSKYRKDRNCEPMHSAAQPFTK